MPTEYFIAMDTHCSFCEMLAMTKTGKVRVRHRCRTAIPDLVALIEEIPRPRSLTFEEGPLADWLARNLTPFVDRLVVCDPRRNRLVAKDGDKDDPLDTEKLAHLFRGGYLKPVHQATSLDRSLLKQHVGFYHSRVRERVRQGHQLVAQFRRHGVFASIDRLIVTAERVALLRQLPPRAVLQRDLQHVYEVYELLLRQEDEIRRDLLRLARTQEPVRRFQELPGVGWIRAVTFFVCLDTPDRFRSKSALWRYCGLGLQRRRSGKGPLRTQRDPRGNRFLKNVLLGAAKSAIAQTDSPFADKYSFWTGVEGLPPSVARRNVGRCLATILWGLWKTGSRYDPAQVRGAGRPAAIADQT